MSALSNTIPYASSPPRNVEALNRGSPRARLKQPEPLTGVLLLPTERAVIAGPVSKEQRPMPTSQSSTRLSV